MEALPLPVAELALGAEGDDDDLAHLVHLRHHQPRLDGAHAPQLDLALIDDDAKLIVATGDEGQIYQVNVKDEETAVLADLDGEQVTAITPDGDALLFSTANPAHLIRMTDKVAKSGTFTSKTYDAGQISLFGMIDLNVKLPAGTSVSVQTRSGNVEDPEMAPWSEWTDATTFASGDDAPPLAPRG